MFAFLFSNSLTVLLFFTLLFPCSLKGQDLDSIQSDTTFKPALKNNRINFILPGAMMSVGALAIKSDILQGINRTVRHHVLATRPNVNNHIEDRIRHIPTASAFVLLPALGIKSKNNFIDKAIVYALATTIGDQVASRLKTSTKHLRPDGSDRRSFPSGHTTTAFIAAELMRKEYKDVSPWLAVAGYTAATATGALRIYHNKHWLTDVVAGAGLGIISTDLAYLIYTKTKGLRNRVPRSQKLMIMPSFQSKSVGMGIVYRPY